MEREREREREKGGGGGREGMSAPSLSGLIVR